MRIMVTGSRTWGVCPHEPKHEDDGAVWGPDCSVAREHRHIMLAAIREHRLDQGGPHELLHGDALGADKTFAAIWYFYGLGPITAYPANWQELGKRAGHVRNDIMVSHMPDLVLAFHLNHSLGTADAIARARKAGLDVHVYPRPQVDDETVDPADPLLVQLEEQRLYPKEEL